MEAQKIGSGKWLVPNREGEILVVATPEEWVEIVNAMNYAYWAHDEGTATLDLFNQMIGVGVL